METKICSMCNQQLPLTQFNYGNRENRSYCRTCNRAYQFIERKVPELKEAFREHMHKTK